MSDTYDLYIENWTNYELEKQFSSLEEATRVANENFTYNAWKIYYQGEVVISADATAGLQQVASEDLHRIKSLEKWTRQKQKLMRVAAQQRERRRTVSNLRRFHQIYGWEYQTLTKKKKVNWIEEGF